MLTSHPFSYTCSQNDQNVIINVARGAPRPLWRYQNRAILSLFATRVRIKLAFQKIDSHRAKPSQAEQSKAKQSKTKLSKAMQCNAMQRNAMRCNARQ